ncbi:VQ motif-containing family protein [Striga asiatica]|uniref:VQ motif-containing family protein n=1 Tax=Striga asiatica TaxID=4170 RepID=A0A5A7Q886_STRAF|nr:VQ motif-containing family protein [Striga asiatica]
MDKGLGDESSSISSSSSASIANNSNSNMVIKQVNKISHKIAKPMRKPFPLPNPPSAAVGAPPTIPAVDPNPHNSGPGQGPPQSQQPPVYNINKNDFRDVVQKLTGSPAHERLPTPPPPSSATHPRPPSSRLQRIRPPPLAQIGNRPPQIAQIHPHPPNDAGHRPLMRGQPLPPLPSVHPAAESPISAYMRFLQNSASNVPPPPLWNGVAQPGDSLPVQNDFGQRPPPSFSPLHPAESPISAYMRFLQNSASNVPPSPLWSGLAPIGGGPRPDSLPPPNELGQRPPPPLQPAGSPMSSYMRPIQTTGGPTSAALPPPPQHHPPPIPFPSPFSAMPLSPLPFGCIPSPRSPYGMMSPGFLFSPTAQFGLPQLPPLSPTFPVPSPRWKGM